MAHQTRDPMPIKELAPGTPDGLVAVVSKLMAKTPEDRYNGCDEVVEALEPFLGDMSANLRSMPSSPLKRNSGSRPGLGGIGSKNNFASLGSKPAMPATPTRGGTGSPAGVRTPTPVGTPSLNTARPQPARVPGRESFNVPTASSLNDTDEAMIPPTPSKTPVETPGLYGDQPSGGWVDEDYSGNSSGLSMLGLIAAAMVLMTAVYFGATLLMK
jgi:serine/threonine-protein kinase